MMLLGERLTRRGGGRVRARQQGRPGRTSSTPRSPSGPAKLASKSPVLMRLGHDAMYRQQDMALDDALEFLRSQLSLDLHDRGHRRGRHGVLREARPASGRDGRWRPRRPSREAEAPAAGHGAADGADRAARTSAARRRSSAAARRRSPSSTSAASSPRASGSTCWSTRAPSSRSGIHGRPALRPARDGGQGGAGRRRDHRLGRGRRPRLSRSPPTTSP